MRRPKKGILIIGVDPDSSRNYMAEVLRVAREIDAQPGETYDVTVYHDDDCPALRGLGYCGCEPIVRRGKPEEDPE